MPHPAYRFRYEAAVLWPADEGVHGYTDDGEVKVGDPVEIQANWDVSTASVVTPDGQTVGLSYRAIVDRRIALESIMYKGSLDEWLGTGSGIPEDQLLIVMSYREEPDIRNRGVARVVGLAKYKGRLPEHS